MIISGGENIYPAQVERVIAEHDDVVANAVIGMPNEKWGEEVVAVVQLVEGATMTLEELRAHCDNFLARYKLPRRLELVGAIPRNPGGKIDKLALRTRLREKLVQKET